MPRDPAGTACCARTFAIVLAIDTNSHVALRWAARALPQSFRHALRDRLVRRPPARWGNLRRTRPFSDRYGIDRGRPGTAVDRVYIRAFLQRNAQDIRGHVLEVEGSNYTNTFGAGRVTARHVLDVDPDNELATIVGDLADPATLPLEAFDTFILTQTLQYIPAIERALQNSYAALAPGGVLLATVPSIARVHDKHDDLWRFTPLGLQRLLESALPEAEISTEGFGNSLAAVAFVLGLAAEEVRREELDDIDPRLPIVACARVLRPA
jgi:SAM-dependent methyltransferase